MISLKLIVCYIYRLRVGPQLSAAEELALTLDSFGFPTSPMYFCLTFTGKGISRKREEAFLNEFSRTYPVLPHGGTLLLMLSRKLSSLHQNKSD